MYPFSMNYYEEINKAESGNLDAMFNVASYIIWGDRKSVLEPELAERAIRYYVENAKAGDTDSMLDLGAVYLDGRGVEKDPEKALEWYNRAAESGVKKHTDAWAIFIFMITLMMEVRFRPLKKIG